MSEDFNCLIVGRQYSHTDGRMVQITSGEFYSNGSISNFWYWKEVFPNGELSNVEENGYGWL
jgi:hypothetical protein